MSFKGFKGASSSILHALRVGSPFKRKQKESSKPVEISQFESGKNAQASDPSIASLAKLTEMLSHYMDSKDIEKIREAYRFADQAHLGQFRSSGAPYITHPIAVTEICAEWKLDANALMAALLHDVIEDQGVLKSEIAEKFNPDVANLVDGLTKLEKINFATKAEQQAESFRKMLLAMAKDVRVILIKLADRLHNIRTLDAVGPEKRRRVANETMEIYTPIAHRLGLNSLVRELQDLCFEASSPNRYSVLHKAVMAARGNRREVLTKITENITTAMPAQGIEAEVSGREKSLFSIYTKMREQKKSFSDVLDIYGFRIIVHTLAECYLALGVIHQLYRPVPGKFKDYIAIPKLNGYQSLHTTLVGPYGTPIEFQIRTRDMDHIAEKGVASHWMYKNDDVSLNDLQKQTHRWLQSLLDIQSQTGDSGEFLEHVKVDLFPDAVYVLTPKGKIISLPRGATPIDFAYSIHTDIGNQIVSAKINGEFVPLKTELGSGDTVEIITSPASNPSAQWLNYVRTGKARSEIRHYLKTVKYEESIQFGEKLLLHALQELNIPMPAKDDPQWDKLAKSSGAHSVEEIMADIGLGRRLAAVVARRFLADDIVATSAAVIDEVNAAKMGTIFIQGTEGQAAQLSSCCCPIPGDTLIACIRPGHGLVVHTEDCPAALRQRTREPERWVSVSWDKETAKHLPTRLEITIKNEKGALGRIAAQIANADSNIIQMSMNEELLETATLQITIQVDDRKHLARVIRLVRHVPQVTRILRVKG
ncbi:MAG: bifunctional (p)ppGpp synthetase/guanosine-3',5'-bis(diphosphate) 3'-pyrophosphohydrolase [Alcaligenaceae bacterium]|nr:bifunctional (p)ppGpp synthetase/guanosine-3',5'-bis(diphosphate) 3'-pyrophosphohydrolase [Alcaligenaceae bacterium]